MTTERPPAVTGVAKGSLGTGTALDDTQVYQVEELAPPAPAPERPPVRRRRSSTAASAAGFGWIAGTALVAVVVTAIVSSGLGAGHPGAELESGAPAAIGPATAAPSAAPTEVIAGGGGGGNGNGHGGGNGNGNGHGGGGGH